MQSEEVAVIETVNRVYRAQVPARVGLLGNPSDGFKGKTLSLLIKNFCATVELLVHNDPADNTIEIVPHARFDRFNYNGCCTFTYLIIYSHNHSLTQFTTGIDDLVTNISVHGYYGGIRLLQATVKTFGKLCNRVGIVLNKATGFKLTYDTTIPRMVGLSGSSAIIIATMRVLMKYYNLTIKDLDVTKEQFPQLILDIEKNELDIAAGLQDRVIQSYGGLVFMDFSNPPSSSSVLDMMNDHIYCRTELALGIYKSLNPALLPCLYLAYNTSFGGDSGKVHSTVKSRWQKNDPELLEGLYPNLYPNLIPPNLHSLLINCY